MIIRPEWGRSIPADVYVISPASYISTWSYMHKRSRDGCSFAHDHNRHLDVGRSFFGLPATEAARTGIHRRTARHKLIF